MNVAEFLALSEKDRRAYFAEMCAQLSDEDMATELVGFIANALSSVPLGKIAAEVTKIVSDIRAGERLRLSRLQ